MDWCWSWSSNTSATWRKELTHWKRSWCWERLKAEEGDNRGWSGWMASLIQWTWVWASSKSWWWTGKLGTRQSIGLQRVGHDWATELNWVSSLWPSAYYQRKIFKNFVNKGRAGRKKNPYSSVSEYSHHPLLSYSLKNTHNFSLKCFIFAYWYSINVSVSMSYLWLFSSSL